MTNKITLGAVAAAVVVGLAAPVLTLAAYMKAGNTVFLAGSDAAGSGNAYIAGGNVNLNAPVNGDILAAGGTIFISGKADGDILAVGGTINVIGAAAQDVRIAGGNITAGGKFTGEMMVAGGQVTVTPDTTVAKDSSFAVGTLNFAGNEAGNLMIAGGNIYIDGTVGGNLLITHAKTVTVGPHAIIKGSFEYTATEAATVQGGAKIVGATTFHEAPATSSPKGVVSGVFVGIFTAWLFMKFLTGLVAAYLLWYLWRSEVVDAFTVVREHFWKELLRGFSVLVLMPVAAIILFVTLIGAVPAIVILLTYILLLVLAVPIALIFAASVIFKSRTDLRWYHVLLGAIVFGIVGLIPVIGWIACFVVYLMALGGLANVLGSKFAR
jgi:cytoskeletal protein CcmA (bactofilin family)